MSYKIEMKVDGKWATNNCAYATEWEADEAGRELMTRWFAPTDHRAVKSDQPVNAGFNHRQGTFLPKGIRLHLCEMLARDAADPENYWESNQYFEDEDKLTLWLRKHGWDPDSPDADEATQREAAYLLKATTPELIIYFRDVVIPRLEGLS